MSDEYERMPCQNGGTCNDGIAGYDCACAPGFTGTRCETNIDECESKPCQNGATCIDGIIQFRCECVFGFRGALCETNIDECFSMPCQNDATCSDGIARYDCACRLGFTGTRCEANIDECESKPCQNGATCNDGIAGYDCECAPGFTGVHCETNLVGCDLNPCMNDGVCVDGNATFTCYCAAGYVGVACTVRNSNPIVSDPDTAANTTCPDGQRCWDEGKTGDNVTYIWSLYKTEDAVSDFAKTLFWRLRNRWHRGGGVFIQPFPQQPLLFIQNGVNVRFETDYTFQKNGNLEVYKVKNIEAYENCDILGGTLVGRIAGKQPFGNPTPKPNHVFTLDVSSTLTSGANYYISVHTEGSGHPSVPENCQQGARLLVYQGDFVCGSNRKVPCNDRAPCAFDLRDSLHYKCECPPGYLGDLCQNIDECLDMTNCGDPLADGVCVDGDGDYFCSCFPSRRGKEDKTCHKPIEFSIRSFPSGCNDTLCKNGGTCIERSGGFFRCECPFGFYGDFCQKKTNDCASNPCENGGTCVDDVASYTCMCPCGYTGPHCGTNIDECAPTNPCLNGASCSDGDDAVVCDCSSPWTGDFCQMHEYDCLTSRCQNGGTCVDGNRGYACKCAPGFTSTYCDVVDTDVCGSFPINEVAALVP